MRGKREGRAKPPFPSLSNAGHAGYWRAIENEMKTDKRLQVYLRTFFYQKEASGHILRIIVNCCLKFEKIPSQL